MKLKNPHLLVYIYIYIYIYNQEDTGKRQLFVITRWRKPRTSHGSSYCLLHLVLSLSFCIYSLVGSYFLIIYMTWLCLSVGEWMAGLVLEGCEGRELAEGCSLNKDCSGRCDCPFCVCFEHQRCVCSTQQDFTADALIGGET